MVDEKGQLRKGALLEAYQQRRKNAAYWQQFAPTALKSMSWLNRGPQNVGGRTRTLLIHPFNNNILWAGSVGGGMWKSTDAGATWTPLDDFLSNLSANTMAMDPADSNILYCGTGEGYFNSDAINGAGIFKSTDGGSTWNQLASTADWDTVNRIAIAPGNSNLILAGKRYGGIFRSTDAGSTWGQVQGAQGSFDVEFDPSNSTKAVAHIIDYDFGIGDWFHSALYSTDSGATWTEATTLNHIFGFDSRMDLAYAPSNTSIVYANCGQSGGKIWRSTDGGHSYTSMTVTGSTGGSWYNNLVWVSPADSNFLVAGGTALYKSTDAGASFTQITAGYLLTAQPHPDQHFVIADPGFNGTSNKRVYATNDGGVFRTDDITTADTTSGWVSLNAGFQTTQYYGADGDGPSQLIVGGTQDNGTLRSPLGSSDATLMFGGDGGYSAIDSANTNYCYGEYVNLQIHRSSNNCQTADYIYGGIADAIVNANFIAPFILDPNNTNRMLAGGASLWRSEDVRTAVNPTWASIRAAGSDLISAIAVASGNSDIIWIGQNDGKVFKTTDGTAVNPVWSIVDDNGSTNPLPDRFPTRILIDPSDSNRVYVAFGGFTDGNLQRTTDGGSTWSDITGSGVTGLPLAPVRGIARDPNNINGIYAGTEVGIFSTFDGGANWIAGQGPANVSVDELVFMHGSSTLLAATHGRGLWTTTIGGAPSNDDCAGASIVGNVPYSDIVDTSAATIGTGDPIPSCGNGSNSKSVWYAYTPSASGILTADTFGSSYDTILSAYTGTCGTFVDAACNDDSAGSQSMVQMNVTAGNIYHFLVSARNTDGGAVTFHLDLAPNCLFCDDFEDSILSGTWQYSSGVWTESGGELHGSNGTRKAKAYAVPAFSGCSICGVTADMETAGDIFPGVLSKLSLIGWYSDNGNYVELLVKESQNKIILKERVSGAVVRKAKALVSLFPNTLFQAKIAFDGSNFQVSVDGTLLITMPAYPGSLPSGTVAFQVKATNAGMDSISVN